MILHLAPVFYWAMFLQKIKLDPSVKNAKFSRFKTCRRFVFLPVFSVLSFPADLSKYLMSGCDEGVFCVPGAWRSQAGAAQCHCFLSVPLVVLLPRSV